MIPDPLDGDVLGVSLEDLSPVPVVPVPHLAPLERQHLPPEPREAAPSDNGAISEAPRQELRMLAPRVLRRPWVLNGRQPVRSLIVASLIPAARALLVTRKSLN